MTKPTIGEQITSIRDREADCLEAIDLLDFADFSVDYTRAARRFAEETIRTMADYLCQIMMDIHQVTEERDYYKTLSDYNETLLGAAGVKSFVIPAEKEATDGSDR